MAVTVKYLELPPEVNLTGIPTRFKVHTSVAGVNITQLKIHLEVLFRDGSSWVDSGFEDIVNADAEGKAEFNVSSYFISLLKPNFTFPEHSSNLAIAHEGMTKIFRVKVWESYLDDGVAVDKEATDSLQSSDFYMLRGGISSEDRKYLEEIGSDWWTMVKNGRKFLTWMPGEKLTCLDATEKLYWFPDTGGTYTFRIAYTDIEGVTGSYTKSITFTGKTMYELCVSPAIAEKLTDKSLLKYTVSISDQTEEASFRIDRRYYEENLFFVFSNSFEVYEGMWCHGAMKRESRYKRNVFEKSLPLRPMARDREQISSRASRVVDYTTNLGYVNNGEWLEWAEDFVMSGDVWHVEYLKLWPIVVTTEKMLTGDSLREEPWDGQFKWQKKLQGRFRSNFGIRLKKILPPYWNDVVVFFNRYEDLQLVDAKSDYRADVVGSDITFPEITGHDAFDFTDRTFWKVSIEGRTWYSGGAPRKCPVSYLKGTGDFAVDATDHTHARLMFADYDGNIKATRVVLYNSVRTAAEQQEIVDWLEWYATLFDPADALLTDREDNVLITKRV